MVRESLCEEVAFGQCPEGGEGALSGGIGTNVPDQRNSQSKGPGVGPVPVPGSPVQWEASDSRNSRGRCIPPLPHCRDEKTEIQSLFRIFPRLLCNSRINVFGCGCQEICDVYHIIFLFLGRENELLLCRPDWSAEQDSVWKKKEKKAFVHAVLCVWNSITLAGHIHIRGDSFYNS